MLRRVEIDVNACVCDGEPVELAACEGGRYAGLDGVQDTGEAEVWWDVGFVGGGVVAGEVGVRDMEGIVVGEEECRFEGSIFGGGG